MNSFDLVCIGSGPAGEKAATQAAYFGHSVAVVEAKSVPGGAMVNTGTVPSKSLRETALMLSSFRRRPIPGIEIEFDSTLSVARFMGQRYHIQQIEHDRIESSFDRHGIQIFHGHGQLVDPNTISISNKHGETQTISAKNILLATGSCPCRPDWVPFDHPRVVDADGILELDSLPKSLLVVGAGVIGCEYACIFSEIGVEVTLVHPSSECLPFLDHECRDRLLAMMRKNGIKIQFGRTVSAVTPQSTGGSIEVQYDDGSIHHAETVLWTAGRSSYTQDLGLEQVGVETDERGVILVDENYRTNIPSIYAAGDVVGFPALASISMEQGRIAACAMFDNNFRSSIADVIPMGIYTIPGISTVGLTEKQAAESDRAILVGRTNFLTNARAHMTGEQDGYLKCVFDAQTQCLLGATMISVEATELIHLAQFAILGKMEINDLITNTFNYPTRSEVFKYAAYSALQQVSGTVEERTQNTDTNGSEDEDRDTLAA